MNKFNKNIVLVITIFTIIFMLYISYLLDRYFYVNEAFESSGPTQSFSDQDENHNYVTEKKILQ